MSGPEHYRVAETLLANLRAEVAGNSGTPLFSPERQARMIAEAQVHATLALTSATIDAAAHPNQSQVDYLSAWWEAGA